MVNKTYIKLPHKYPLKPTEGIGNPDYDIYSIGSVVELNGNGRLFAVGVDGVPPYSRITGVNNGQLVERGLKYGSHEYQRVLKWVSLFQRGLFNEKTTSPPTAIATKEEVMAMLSQ